MKQLKAIICTGMAVAMLLVNTGTVNAATHISGCSTTTKSIVCGSVFNRISNGSHVLYTTANGTVVACSKEAEMRHHVIKCSNLACGAVYQSDAIRTCTIIHTYCPNETGCCQYQ